MDLALPINLFSFLILSYTSSGGVTFFLSNPSILCILYSLLKTFLIIFLSSPFKLFIIRTSFFLSRPKPKAKKPSFVTLIFFLSIVI